MPIVDHFIISNATKADIEGGGVTVPAGKTALVTIDVEENPQGLANLISQGGVIAPGSLTNETSQVADNTTDVVNVANLVEKGAQLLLSTGHVAISAGTDEHAKIGI